MALADGVSSLLVFAIVPHCAMTRPYFLGFRNLMPVIVRWRSLQSGSEIGEGIGEAYGEAAKQAL